jgi:hypothetical protein
MEMKKAHKKAQTDLKTDFLQCFGKLSSRAFACNRSMFDPPIIEKTAGHVAPRTSRPGGFLAFSQSTSP